VTEPNSEYGAATRALADVAFDLVGALEIQRLPTGIPVEYTHRLQAGTRPNRHAAGPFCRFELASSHNIEGVYAILVGSDLRYIGECADLARRFGPLGYGHVSSRNCHHDGQATNCKINSKVLASAKAGQTVTVWFHSTSDRKALEADRGPVSTLEWHSPCWSRRSAVTRTSDAGKVHGRRRRVPTSPSTVHPYRSVCRRWVRAGPIR